MTAVLRLTPREREVVVLYAKGLTMNQIAAALRLAPATARQRGKDACHRNGTPTIAELAERFTGRATVEIIGYEEARHLARERRRRLQAERSPA